MDGLYLKTKQGNVPIDPAVAEKYHLEAGEEAPFTGGVISGGGGRAPKTPQNSAKDADAAQGELINDEIAELENGVTLSQSEIIDFGQGTDSSNR